MLIIQRVIRYSSAAILCSMAAAALAQTAPVYDVEAMPQDPFYHQDVQQGHDNAPAEATAYPAPDASNPGPVRPDASESYARVESLQDQVQTLRGQVEQLTHQIEQLQQQKAQEQASTFEPAQAEQRPTEQRPTDVQNTANIEETNQAQSSLEDIPVKRMAVPAEKPAQPATEKAITQAPAPKSKPVEVVREESDSKPSTQPNVAEEQRIYQSAYNLIKEKKYKDAVDVLEKMLKKYPSGQFASNAHYWLGELYGLMGNHDKAMEEFKIIVKSYPNSPRISDAQLKVGLILASKLKWADAKTELKKVINHYPGTSSAKLAAEQLKQIKLAGH